MLAIFIFQEKLILLLISVIESDSARWVHFDDLVYTYAEIRGKMWRLIKISKKVLFSVQEYDTECFLSLISYGLVAPLVMC